MTDEEYFKKQKMASEFEDAPPLWQIGLILAAILFTAFLALSGAWYWFNKIFF